MTMFKNRWYQDKLIAESVKAWADGHKVVMAVSPTGSGKTQMMSSIIKQHVGYGVAMVHRGELVSQISVDVLTAAGMNARDAETLRVKIEGKL